MLLSAWRIIAPLCNLIDGVFLVRPKKEVIWVHAFRVVALMKDAQPAGDRSKVKSERETVRAGVAKLAISRAVWRALPLPALLRPAPVNRQPKFRDFLFAFLLRSKCRVTPHAVLRLYFGNASMRGNWIRSNEIAQTHGFLAQLPAPLMDSQSERYDAAGLS